MLVYRLTLLPILLVSALMVSAPMTASMLLGSPAAAQGLREPSVPPADDPGGITVALLGDGADYTDPVIAGCLARDGEGDPIAWDFTDDDLRPYAADGPGTADATSLCRDKPGLRLIVVKELPGDPSAFGHMMVFAARTPARIVVWPDGHPKRSDWRILGDASRQFPNLLFIAPAPPLPPPGAATLKPPGRSVQPPANLLLVSHAESDRTSARLRIMQMTRRAAALLREDPKRTPAMLLEKLSGH